MAPPGVGSGVFRVADINTGGWVQHRDGLCGDNDEGALVSVGPTGYFIGYRPGHGCEIYRTAGEPGDAAVVTNLSVAPGGPTGLLGAAGGIVYFRARTVTLGAEIWRTDGTADGTFLLRDFVPGPEDTSSIEGWFADLGGVALFGASDPKHGFELWRSDGTPDGTTLVYDFSPDDSGLGPHRPLIRGSQIYFFAGDDEAGLDVWRSDGTTAGTVRVTELGFEPHWGGDPGLALLGDGLLILGRAASGQVGLWRTDGTPGVAELLVELPWASEPVLGLDPLAIGDVALWAIQEEGGPPALWSTDGTAQGTRGVPFLASPDLRVDPYRRAVGDGRVFFVGIDAEHGAEPWTTDGTPAGTRRIADVRLGAEGSFDLESGGHIDSFAGGALLPLDDGTHGAELWYSDGTPGGTYLIEDLAPGRATWSPRFVGRLSGRAILAAAPAWPAFDLYRTDGQPGSIVRLTDLARTTTSSFPGGMEDEAGLLFFSASSSGWEGRPWRSDGTEEGTFALEGDLGPFHGGGPYSTLDDGTVMGLSHAEEASLLWSSDGEGLVPLGEFSVGCGPRWQCGIGEVPAAGPVALFDGGWTEEDGSEPWASDGTPSGTGTFIDIWPGAESSQSRLFTEIGSRVWFVALDPIDGDGVWSTGGTLASTQRLADLAPGAEVFEPTTLMPFDAEAGSFFMTRYEPHGHELWFHPGPGSHPRRVLSEIDTLGFLGISGSRALFRLQRYEKPGVGAELWSSDGTEVGTRLVRDIWPGPIGSMIEDPAPLYGRLYFRACEPLAGCELWSSDGTPQGTSLSFDFLPGPDSSYPHGMSSIDGRLYLYLCEPTSGCELWSSDGSLGGTHSLADLVPGPGSSGIDPEWQSLEIVRSGPLIYFAADDGTGAELWAIASTEIFRDGVESGDISRWSDVQP